MGALVSSDEATTACRVIFGPREHVSATFLDQLTISHLRRVYRRRALESHPDRATILGDSPGAMGDRFKALTSAYDTVRRYLLASERRHTVRPQGSPRDRRNNGPGRRDSKPRTHYWTGSIPARRLPLGQFLYYSRRICWTTLIQSIVWQRQQRPRFGHIAVDAGYLNRSDLVRILQQRNASESVGEAAVRMRCLTPHERDLVLSHQMRAQRPIGHYFLEHGMLSPDELVRVLREQRIHNNSHRAASCKNRH